MSFDWYAANAMICIRRNGSLVRYFSISAQEQPTTASNKTKRDTKNNSMKKGTYMHTEFKAAATEVLEGQKIIQQISAQVSYLLTTLYGNGRRR